MLCVSDMNNNDHKESKCRFTVWSMCLLSPAGWLLDITKLTLGENIGEGEFGGELPYLILFTG